MASLILSRAPFVPFCFKYPCHTSEEWDKHILSQKLGKQSWDTKDPSYFFKLKYEKKTELLIVSWNHLNIQFVVWTLGTLALMGWLHSDHQYVSNVYISIWIKPAILTIELKSSLILWSGGSERWVGSFPGLPGEPRGTDGASWLQHISDHCGLGGTSNRPPLLRDEPMWYSHFCITIVHN